MFSVRDKLNYETIYMTCAFRALCIKLCLVEWHCSVIEEFVLNIRLI